MKKQLAKPLVICILAMFTLSVFSAIPILAIYNPGASVQDPYSQMYMDQLWYNFTSPPSKVGTKFNVTVYSYNISKLYSYQVVIVYNASLINCTNAWPNNGWVDPDWVFTKYGSGASELTAWSHNENPGGTVPAGFNAEAVGDVHKLIQNITLTGTEALMARFEFEILVDPPRYGELCTVLDLANAFLGGTSFNHVGGPSTSPDLTNSHYCIKWVPPPEPWLEVDPGLPTTIDYGPFYSIGQQFNISVWLKSIDAEHWLENATFDLTYNSTLLEVTNVYEGPFLPTYGGTAFDWSDTDGTVHVTEEITSWFNGYPSGDGVIAKIEFNITFQHGMGELPDPRVSGLDLTNIVLTAFDDATIEIDEAKVVNGEYRIFAFVPVWDIWFEVQFSPSHELTLGPDYVIGQTFDAIITINNTRPIARMIGYQFRLKYPETIVEIVEVTQGPFLSQFNSTYPPPYTYFTAMWDFDGELLVGELILPRVEDSTAVWGPDFPDGSGVVAIITFKVIHQSPEPFDETFTLEFINGNETFCIDDEQEKLNLDQSLMVDGTVNILGWTLDGRRIDVYAGMYETPFPAPYGGQGANMPSDMFWPQKTVWLWANVTYNYWPEQNKFVTFEIFSPQGYFTTLTAVTDEEGVAVVSFRIPWPCDEPDNLFGVWQVVASVDIASQVVYDELEFHYDYLVHIWEVTPDRPPGPCSYYKHCDWIEITVDYGSYAMQTYDVKIVVVVKDELNVPIGTITIETTVGGAEWCSYNNFQDMVTMHVIKWAHAGYATIHANVFAWNPYRQEWFVAGPEAQATIIIQPEWA